MIYWRKNLQVRLEAAVELPDCTDSIQDTYPAQCSKKYICEETA